MLKLSIIVINMMMLTFKTFDYTVTWPSLLNHMDKNSQIFLLASVSSITVEKFQMVIFPQRKK